MLTILDFEKAIQTAASAPAKASLDPNLPREELMHQPVKDLKGLLQSKGIDHSACVEKQELVDLIKSKLASL